MNLESYWLTSTMRLAKNAVQFFQKNNDGSKELFGDSELEIVSKREQVYFLHELRYGRILL